MFTLKRAEGDSGLRRESHKSLLPKAAVGRPVPMAEGSSRLASTYLAERLHLVQHPVDLWHHVSAIHHNGCVRPVPEGHMQHCPILEMTDGD